MNEEGRYGVLASMRMPRPILLVSAATRARRVPEPAVVVGAVVGVRSVLRKLVGADVGARFAAARSKHGEMNREGPRGSRHGAAVLRCNVRAEHQGQLGHHPAWSHTWDIRNAHTLLECAHPTVRLACVCALPCMRLLAFVCGEGATERRREGWARGDPRSRTAVRECPQWEWPRSPRERASRWCSLQEHKELRKAHQIDRQACSSQHAARCELHAVSWTLHHIGARCAVGVPHVGCRKFVVAVGCNGAARVPADLLVAAAALGRVARRRRRAPRS